MSRIATVSWAHTVPEKMAMTTKNDGIETGALTNSPQVTIAGCAEPTLSDRDDRPVCDSATSVVLERGGLRLRGKLRDGAGKPGHVPDTLGHKHANLHLHVPAARHSQLTIPRCRTRDIPSNHCCPARAAWGLPRGPYYKVEHGEVRSAQHRQGGGKVASGAPGQTPRAL